MRPPLSVLSAVILLTACGGGGHGSGPSSMVGMTLISASPPPGSTLTVAPNADGLLVTQLSMTFSVVSDTDIKFPWGLVEWMAGGQQCATQNLGLPYTDIPNIMKDHPVTITVPSSNFRGSCPLPTTTSTIRVTVMEFVFCLDHCAAVPTFSRDLPISYTFVVATPSGGQ